MSHWQNRTWLTSEDIPTNLIQLGQRLMDRESKLFERFYIDDLNEAIAEAFAANLQDSYAIENEHLNSSYIKSSIIKQMNLDLPGWSAPSPGEHDRESRAVKMTLALLNTNDLSHEMICNAHGMLGDSYLFGNYRNADEVIVDGSHNVIYNAPEPYLVKGQMDDFINWWNDDRKNLPNQIGSAIGHYIFVVIHPFGDGNGRIARALSEKGMIPDESKIFRPYSLSSQILMNRGRYYQALESGNPLDFPVFMLNMHALALDDGFYKAGRLHFLKYYLDRASFADNEKAMIKVMALNKQIAWMPSNFDQIENAQDAWDNLRTKGVIDENGAFKEDWRPSAKNTEIKADKIDSEESPVNDEEYFDVSP